VKQTLNEEIARIKTMMNLKEDDSQTAMVQQAVDEFNEKAEENLTPDEIQEVMCTDPDSVDIPSNVTNEQKQKLEEFKQKLKATTSISELKEVKRQLKELRKQSNQEQNEQAGMVTLLGVTMPQGFALVIGGIMLIMVLNILFKLFNIHLIKTVTYWCTGRKTTGFSFGRN
jgi:TusA-related sulfurtransferase